MSIPKKNTKSQASLNPAIFGINPESGYAIQPIVSVKGKERALQNATNAINKLLPGF